MNAAIDTSVIEKMLHRIEAKVALQAVEVGEWVMPNIIEARYGLTTQAIKEYRRTIWPEGIYWHKNQKGRIVYSTKMVNKWMATPCDEY